MTLSPRELEDLVLRSLGDHLVLSKPGETPIRSALQGGDEGMVFRIFRRNITHGGASRSPDEFRIQLTGHMPDEVVGEQTLIIGWSDTFQVFAAWDPRYHLGRLSTSPSLQIHRDVLVRAFDEGVAAEVRGSGDVVVAFQPALLRAYGLTVDAMHSEDASVVAADLNAIPVKPSQPQPVMRTKVTQTIQSYFRAGDFARRVLGAYDGHCAVCGLQLGLVEAAHIVPVAWPGSTDETSNGLCLCSNHHKAYDAALVTIGADNVIRVSSVRQGELAALGLSGGASDLADHHGQMIRYLPADPADRPSPAYLAEGQIARKWKA